MLGVRVSLSWDAAAFERPRGLGWPTIRVLDVLELSWRSMCRRASSVEARCSVMSDAGKVSPTMLGRVMSERARSLLLRVRRLSMTTGVEVVLSDQ